MNSDTILVECNRLSALNDTYQGFKQADVITAPNFQKHRWTSNMPEGLVIKAGDEIQLEAAMLNAIGAGDSVIEFTGKVSDDSSGVATRDNAMNLTLSYYLTDRNQFNFKLPKREHIPRYDYSDGGADGQMYYGGPNLTHYGYFHMCYPQHSMEGAYWSSTERTAGSPDTTFKPEHKFVVNTTNGVQIEPSDGSTRVLFASDQFLTVDNVGQWHPTRIYGHGAVQRPGYANRAPSSKRLFVLKKDSNGPYIGPINAASAADLDDYHRSTVPLEVPIGFQSTSALETTLTDQLHQRSATTQSLDPQTFQVNGAFSSTDAPALTDHCMQVFPTSSGKPFYARLEGKWQATLHGESGNEGANYVESEGLRVFYQHLLVGDKERYRAMQFFHHMKKEGFAGDAGDRWTQADVDTGQLYAGPINEGFYGQIVIMSSHLRQETVDTSTMKKTSLAPSYDDSGYADGTTHSLVPAVVTTAAMPQWVGKACDLVVLNVPYTDVNLNKIASAFHLAERPTTDEPVDYRSKAFLDQLVVDLDVGELDDGETNVALGDYVQLCSPHVAQRVLRGTVPSSASYIPYDVTTLMTSYDPLKSIENFYSLNNGGGPSKSSPGGGNDSTKNLHMKYRLANLQNQTRTYSAPFKSRFNADMDYANAIKVGGSYKYTLGGDSADWQFTDQNSNTVGTALSQKYDVAVVPVYATKSSVWSDLKDPWVPMMAVVLGSDLAPGTIPLPEVGEFFGFSRSLSDGVYSQIASTRKVRSDVASTTAKGATAEVSSHVYPALKDSIRYDYDRQLQIHKTEMCPADDYVSHVMLGSDNPSFAFDVNASKFSVKQLHTSIYDGNLPYQTWSQQWLADALNSENTQASDTPDEKVIRFLGKDAHFCTVGHNLWTTANFDVQTAHVGTVYMPLNVDVFDVVAPVVSETPYECSQSGVSLEQLESVDTEGTSHVMSPFADEMYSGTMFEKLGFSLEQLLPTVGRASNEFNRDVQNRFVGPQQSGKKKYEFLVKPLTTNDYVGTSMNIGLGSTANGHPTYNMSATIFSETSTNGGTDALLATNLARKLDYPYLVVYSNIVDNSSYYGGANSHAKLPAVAYIPRSYTTGDFVYASGTTWAYTADKDYVLSDITVDVRMPSGDPAPLDANSAVIFKVTRPKPSILELHNAIMQGK